MMTVRKEETGRTTGYNKTARPTPGTTTTGPSTHCTETWDEALEAGFFGEAPDDSELVFPGPEPEPPPPEPEVESSSEARGKKA